MKNRREAILIVIVALVVVSVLIAQKHDRSKAEAELATYAQELADRFPETNTQDFEILATFKDGKEKLFKCHVEYDINQFRVQRDYRKLEELELTVKIEVLNVIRTLLAFESGDDFDEDAFEKKVELLMIAPMSRAVTVTELNVE